MAKRGILTLAALLLGGLVLPGGTAIPVEGATPSDWNPRTFWAAPWGASGVHKGIDIFARQGKAVIAATPGLVIYRGQWARGGNVVAVLGPKWRIHYYAHLDRHDPARPWLVWTGTPLGTVGTSGNAAGKPPHLHYSILSLVPLPWRWDDAPQGAYKMLFLDPGAVLMDG